MILKDFKTTGLHAIVIGCLPTLKLDRRAKITGKLGKAAGQLELKRVKILLCSSMFTLCLFSCFEGTDSFSTLKRRRAF